jgi:hypothetical protein
MYVSIQLHWRVQHNVSLCMQDIAATDIVFVIVFCSSMIIYSIYG